MKKNSSMVPSVLTPEAITTVETNRIPITTAKHCKKTAIEILLLIRIQPVMALAREESLPLVET